MFENNNQRPNKYYRDLVVKNITVSSINGIGVNYTRSGIFKKSIESELSKQEASLSYMDPKSCVTAKDGLPYSTNSL